MTTAGPYRRSAQKQDAAARLDAAMDEARPSCAADDRFTDDYARLDPEIEPELFATCYSCPLLAACEEYAASAKPSAGYWAGQWRGKTPRPRTLAALNPNGGGDDDGTPARKRR